MNIAIIIAGGRGSRMGQKIPKQFINVCDKPVIIYTLEAFQRHPQIDGIEVVCLDEWQDYLMACAEQFHITKLKQIVKGGTTVQGSIQNGVFSLEGKCTSDDIVIIHDAIRPLVDEAVISDVIDKCRQYGNAVASLPCYDQFFVTDNKISTVQYIPREMLRRVTTPQAYLFEKIDWGYHQTPEEKITAPGSSYANTMMVDLGERLYFTKDSETNIKLTTKSDLRIFRAYLNQKGKNEDTLLK